MNIDLFAGGGGTSTGIELAGLEVDVAVNHSPAAIAMHARNHPRTRHLCASVWDVSPREVVGRRKVGLLWMSPDCTHFSRAKGGKPRETGRRSLAHVGIEWARAVRPDVICLEHVEEFATWGPLLDDGTPCKRRAGESFRAWVAQLEWLGYEVEWRTLVAADFGAPTTRKRLFLIARRDGRPIVWPEPTHGPGRAKPWRTAAEIIDWSHPCPSIFGRRKPLADATMRRIARGLDRFVLKNPSPFIIRTDMQSDGRLRGLGSLADPLRTLTTTGGHALVAPYLVQTSYGERAGQAPRVLDIHRPLTTVVAGGAKHGLVAAFLTKHYGGVVGHGVTQPIGSVTTQDHHALTTATLHPAQVDRRAEVRAFLVSYYGNGAPLSVADPLDTVTTRDRFGLVTVDGLDYEIADIGMRMLQPRELFRAQGFPDTYDLLDNELTKTEQIQLCGNSVCPPVAAAIVRANIKTRPVTRRPAPRVETEARP